MHLFLWMPVLLSQPPTFRMPHKQQSSERFLVFSRRQLQIWKYSAYFLISRTNAFLSSNFRLSYNATISLAYAESQFRVVTVTVKVTSSCNRSTSDSDWSLSEARDGRWAFTVTAKSIVLFEGCLSAFRRIPFSAREICQMSMLTSR